ncbi:hypothetical protein SGRIM128S_08990 [Streptomyces griseomycini]
MRSLPHDGGGVGVVALDVADDGADPASPGGGAPGQRDQVVPVTADVPADGAADGGGPVAHGDVGAGHAGYGARQHGLLQAPGEVHLLLVEHRALQALGDAAAQGDQDVALLGGEAAPVAVEQAHAADGAGLDDERQVGRGGDVQPGDALPQLRVVLGELLRGLDEARAEGAHRLAHRVRLVDPGDLGARHVAAFGSVRDEPDPAGLDQAHDQAGGTQVGEPVGVLEDVDDVLHGTGVGEGGGGELDDVRLPAAGVRLGGLLAPGLAVAEFPGGVPDDADDRGRGPLPVHDLAG